jgi:hypothetical protein
MPEKLKGLPVLQSTLNIGFHSAIILYKQGVVSTCATNTHFIGQKYLTMKWKLPFWNTIEAWTRNLGSFLYILRGSTVRDDITRRGDTSTGAAAQNGHREQYGQRYMALVGYGTFALKHPHRSQVIKVKLST